MLKGMTRICPDFKGEREDSKITAMVAQDRENVHQTGWGKSPGQRPTLSQFH